MALELTQPLIEMSTRNISWGVKAAGAECLEIWEPAPPGTLGVRPGLQWDGFRQQIKGTKGRHCYRHFQAINMTVKTAHPGCKIKLLPSHKNSVQRRLRLVRLFLNVHDSLIVTEVCDDSDVTRRVTTQATDAYGLGKVTHQIAFKSQTGHTHWQTSGRSRNGRSRIDVV